jgi:hypothetical protein
VLSEARTDRREIVACFFFLSPFAQFSSSLAILVFPITLECSPSSATFLASRLVISSDAAGRRWRYGVNNVPISQVHHVEDLLQCVERNLVVVHTGEGIYKPNRGLFNPQRCFQSVFEEMQLAGEVERVRGTD